MYTKEKKRNEFAQFIKLGEMEKPLMFGWGVESSGISYSEDSDTKQYVVEGASRTIVKGYTLQTDVEQEVFSDDPLFKEIDKIRRLLETGEKANGEIVNVNFYLGDTPVAQKPTTPIVSDKFDIKIAITDFGEAAEDLLKISYTIHYQGAPVQGTAVVDWDTLSATFTPDTNIGE